MGMIGAYHLNTKVPITKWDLAEAADAQGNPKCVCYNLGLQDVTPGVELAGESSGKESQQSGATAGCSLETDGLESLLLNWRCNLEEP
jgi:hypothetical protein